MSNHHPQLWLTTTFSYDQSPPSAKCNHHLQLFLITTFARSDHHHQLTMSATSFLLYFCSLGAILVLSECSLNALWVLLKWIWGKKMKIESSWQVRLAWRWWFPDRQRWWFPNRQRWWFPDKRRWWFSEISISWAPVGAKNRNLALLTANQLT